MALHFERSEYDARRDRLLIEMAAKKLDAILLFAQESMYWLTGYDTFGYCFFQCLVVKLDGSMTLLTRSADLRQARHTSILDNILVWTDRDNVNPAIDLRNLIVTAEAVNRAALLREESRGAHTRLDFEGEREDWGKVNIVVSRVAGGTMEARAEQRNPPPEELRRIAYATLEELEGTQGQAAAAGGGA